MGNKLPLIALLLLGCLPSWLPAESLLDSLEQRARANYRIDFDSSIYFAEQILLLAPQENDHDKVAFAYNWKGICFLATGQSDSARHYLDLCTAYAAQHQVIDVQAKAFLNKSILANQTGDYERSVDMGLEALAFFEQIGDSLGIAGAYYNTGLSYQRMERFAAAKDFYYQALPIYQSKGGVLNQANNLNAIGSIWTIEEEPDSALKYHEAAAAVKIAVGAGAYCGSEYSNIAAIYEEKGDWEQAEDYYGRSFRAYNAFGDMRGVGLVSTNLSKFKYEAAEWDSAIYFGELGLEYADSTEDRYILSLSHIRLSKAYTAIGDFEQALYHDQIFDSLDQEIRGAEVQKNIDELHIQYETEKKDKEIAERRVESQRKNFWLMGSVGGILALLVVFLFWYRSEKEKKQKLVAQGKNDLETERNRISMDLHDHLGAELSIITSQLDIQSFKVQDPNIGEALESLANQAREANAQLRETIWSVQSTEVSLAQFVQKVREFADRLLAESALQFKVHLEGEATLGPALALGLFRVVQEAIHNAHKYSGGDTLRFSVERQGQTLRVVVQDNGRGLGETKIRDGYGLQNMEDRVRKLGGSFELDGSSGTRIQISIPVKS